MRSVSPGGPFQPARSPLRELYLSRDGCVQKDFCPFSRRCRRGKYLTCGLFESMDIGIGVAGVMVKQYEALYAGLASHTGCHDRGAVPITTGRGRFNTSIVIFTVLSIMHQYIHALDEMEIALLGLACRAVFKY